jgi:hypothetical protein
MNAIKQAILQKYRLSPNELVRKGMEAEVYALGTNSVLKLYPGTISLADLTTLQDFYASLDKFTVPYFLPYIETVAAQGEFCISIERLLPGTRMSAILPRLTQDQLDRMMQTYLNAALALNRIQIPPDFDRFKLFDSDGISCRTNGDWHQFLARFLARKLTQVRYYLSKDVTNFARKVERLETILTHPYTGNYCLIHGDFFPGNLLIDTEHNVSALLDFGLLTMYGDPLFDIATGWVFFDMYDDLKTNVRGRYLSRLLETLGERVQGVLYRYVLVYSFLSANTYSPQCADGHYQWCVTNLNNQEYWDKIE